MRRVNDLQLEWKTVIFGEPTELKLASGHKGNLIFTVKARGKAGHSGYPWLGQSANHMLVPALVALQKLELPSSEKYGNSTLNIGQIMGGIAASERFLADLCPNSSPETCSESIIPIDLVHDPLFHFKEVVLTTKA